MAQAAVTRMYEQMLEVCEASMREELAARYHFGLSVGQSTDYSALAILEELQRARLDEPKILHCRHLQRWPLRTPYDEIVADTARLLASARLKAKEGRPVCAIDATGVGAPVVQLFRRAKVKATVKPYLLTGGDEATTEGDFTRIPKRDLVSAAQIAFQAGRLKIAEGLEYTPTLRRELESFQVKIVLSSGDVETPWREGAHDDLVLAVMVALWSAEHSAGRVMTWA